MKTRIGKAVLPLLLLPLVQAGSVAQAQEAAPSHQTGSARNRISSDPLPERASQMLSPVNPR